MGARAYEHTMRTIEDSKEAEARIITAVTKGLERHASEGRKSENLKSYLVRNQKMWIALRNDLASEGNAFPTKLKAELISLALWVERQTAAVLTGRGDVEDIIAVNRNLVSGLSGVARN